MTSLSFGRKKIIYFLFLNSEKIELKSNSSRAYHLLIIHEKSTNFCQTLGMVKLYSRIERLEGASLIILNLAYILGASRSIFG